mmetsp:Transcript_115116/g.365730  ORF Transcript_115116/g.365730 Transcript_115116/m.365730 type:complete len:848 (-) Transcript_115116:104-2647(-)
MIGGRYRERPQRLPPMDSSCLLLDDASMFLDVGVTSGSTYSPSRFRSTNSRMVSMMSGPSGALTERPLRSLSHFGHRANERAAEADVEISAHDRQEAQGSLKSSDHSGSTTVVGNLRDMQKQAFNDIVSSINAALSGDVGSPARVVRKDEVVTDTVPLHGSRQYRIPLPSRPVAVVVSFKITAGPRCTLWGSTSCERPSARNYDVKGKDDKILYEHVQKGGDEDADGLQVHSVRELFVSVEADAGEASFRLSVGLTAVKVVLSRAELTSRVQKMRRGWESKLVDLQKDVNAREQFEDRVKQLRDDRRKHMLQMHHGVDYLQRNMSMTLEGYSDNKSEKMIRQADKSKERHVKAVEIKQDLEKQQEQQGIAWLNRGEGRRRERELQEMEDRQREERVERQRQWLIRLAVHGFAFQTGMKYTENKGAFELEVKQKDAAGVLRRFFIRFAARRRRANLYKNVIKFRLAVASYVRVMATPLRCAAQSIVKGFLESYVGAMEEPSIDQTLRSFRAHVVRIQRLFRQVLMIRKAYVQLFFEEWQHIQDVTLERMIKAEDQRLNDQEIRALELLKSLEGGGKPPMSPRSKVKVTSTRETLEAAMPPAKIIRGFLCDYVKQMQKSRAERIKKWKENNEDDAINADLEKCGIHQEPQDGKPKVYVGKPRSVYKDKAELQKLVEDRIGEWMGGVHKDKKANRQRLMQGPFDLWERLVRAKKLGIDNISELQKRRHLNRRRLSSTGGAEPRQTAVGRKGTTRNKNSTRKGSSLALDPSTFYTEVAIQAADAFSKGPQALQEAKEEDEEEVDFEEAPTPVAAAVAAASTSHTPPAAAEEAAGEDELAAEAEEAAAEEPE